MNLGIFCGFSKTATQHFRLEWLAFTSALILISGLMTYSLLDDYRDNRQREQMRLADQVQVVHDNLVRQLNAINRVLISVRNELPRWQNTDNGMERANARLTAFVDAMPSVRTLLLTDANGRVLASNHAELLGMDFHQRGYFQAPLQHPDMERLYVGEPFQTVLNVFAMNVVRMIPAANGAFNGVVSASLNPDEFDTLLSSVRYAPDVWTALAHGDGHLFMMVPPHPEQSGRNLLQPGSMFSKHRASGANATVLIGKVLTAGEGQRMIAQRTVQPAFLSMDKALIVAASRALRAIDAPIWEKARLYGGLLVLLVMVSAPILCWSQRRRHALTMQISETEQALQDASRELERFFNLSPDLVCIKDRAQRLLKFNPSWETILAYPPAELQNMRFLDLVHPQDIEATRRIILDLPADTAVNGFVNRCRHHNGSYLTLEWSASAQQHLIYATARDISDERRNQQALADSERFLRTALEVLPGGVGYWNAELRCTFANSSYAAMFDKTLEQMYGAQYAEVAHGELLEREPRLRAALSGIAQDFYQVIHHPHQGMRYDLVRYVPDCVDGEVRGVFALVADITEVKQGQLRLETLNEELTQRTAEAEAASRYKSQFLANMSHEIRTPLNAVLGLLQLLQHTALTTRQLDYAQKAQVAAEALLAILNDILDLSKIEADKIEIDRAPFQFDQILSNLSVVLSSAVKDKNIEVLFDIGSGIPQTLHGDALRLQQVLLNLSGNAIKFTEEGEVVLALRVMERSAEQVSIQFTVRDTGIGIAADKLESIFAVFTQAETSTTRRYGGTGLGLAISRRLVRLMGGELQVSSVLGSGSSFSFTLDFTQPAPESIETRLLEQGKAALRVLIVDDNAIARAVLGQTAQQFGWQVQLAASGAEALSQFGANTYYDAIFLDWKMPGMDGWETARAIHELCGMRSAPLMIMITARGREMLTERMSSEPELIDGFLIKPVTTSMLFNSVVEATQGAAATLSHVNLGNARRLHGLRLLLVEDNRLNQQVARELLLHEGAEVEIADDGAQGVEQVRNSSTPFDAVLMDVQMPQMDGFTATQIIRTQLDLRTLPIIAMTANAMPADREACFAAGMNDHVGKPIDLEVLVATLRQHCAHAPPLLEALKAPATLATTHADLPIVSKDLALVEALERLNNDRQLYAQLARSLRADQGQAVTTARAFLEQGLTKEALTTLHTLKGVTATLGVRTVAQLTAELEGQIRAAAPTAALFAALDAALHHALDELERVAALWSAPLASGGLQLEAASHCLELLEKLLAERNMRAIEAYNELKTALGAQHPQLAQALNQAMQRLDFATALKCCGDLRRVL